MFTLPIQLPSRGKFGKSHINLKAPTVDEIRAFLAFEGKHVQAINSLVNSLSDTPLDEYPVGDRNYVFVNIRKLVNPVPISGTFTCTTDDCNTANNFTIEFNEIEVVQLPNDFVHPSEITLPISHNTLKLSLITVAKELLLTNFLDLCASADDTYKHKDLGPDLEQFARYAMMLESDLSIEDRISKLREMDYTDYEVLMLYDAAFSTGPKISKRCVCSKCKRAWRVSVPLDSDFLGISLESLMVKHRFLSKTSSIGYQDFLKYTLDEMNFMVDKELQFQDEKKRRKSMSH